MPDQLPVLDEVIRRLILRALSAVRWRWRCQRAVDSARRDTLANLSAGAFQRVLVVCYGNIYRSPFVAARLRQCCGEGVQVRSCGFHRQQDRSSPKRHVAMSATRGVDLATHRSTVIGPDDVNWADLIVLMDRHNWQALRLMGAPADRLAWLGALDDGPVEIPDPYNLDELAAGEVLARLDACAVRLAELCGHRRAAAPQS